MKSPRSQEWQLGSYLADLFALDLDCELKYLVGLVCGLAVCV